MPGEPLTPRELEIVRGMIDQHEYMLRRNKMWAGAWGTVNKIAVGLSAAAVLAASIKGLVGG